MFTARIVVDGKGYHGESMTETYPADYGGGGWHVANHQRRACLIFKDDAGETINGVRNLRSHLERIVSAIQDGHIEGNEIKIIREQEDAKRTAGR